MHGCETWLLTWREEHRLKVFEKRVLRRLFGLKRDKVTGEWRILHNKEHNDLYSSPNIIWVIKLRRMRWAGYVACMGGGGEKVHTEFWCGSLKERYHLEDQGIDGRITLKWIFMKWEWGHGLDLSGSGHGQVTGSCECGNEPSGSIKCRVFLE